MNIALHIAGPTASSLYTERMLRAEARRLAGRETIIAMHVSVREGSPSPVQLVVEHRSRVGIVTVSRSSL